MAVTKFQIEIPAETLLDLKERLGNIRWPDETKGAGWDYGTNLEYLKALIKYWTDKYDLPKHEADLNRFQHFKTKIDGIGIHFIHERGKGPNPTPLLLTHGWPDSFYRFHKIIPMLTDPKKYGGKDEDSFDVVTPSMPGFGFSDRKPMATAAIADLWVKLMGTLKYEQFAAAGGDAGAIVTKHLALKYPKVITAVHLTDVGYPTGQEDFSTMSEDEQKFAGAIKEWWMREGAFNMVHSTRPQTLSLGLNDSPTGLAGWIIGMIKSGADGEKVDEAFGSRDALLTNIMIYWVTETISSSVRMYAEEAKATYANGGGSKPLKPSKVPTAVALFPREAQFPREWAARSLNVQRFTRMPKGGHFAALEVPELYVKDIWESFRELGKL